MGEIADMHIEAYAAGLDPNEMDGADWADFYDEGAEPQTPKEHAYEFAADIRVVAMDTLARAGSEGDTPADTLRRLFPHITEGQARGFFSVVEAIGGFGEAATLRTFAAQKDELVRRGSRLADAAEGGGDLTDALNAWDKACAAIARATGEKEPQE